MITYSIKRFWVFIVFIFVFLGTSRSQEKFSSAGDLRFALNHKVNDSYSYNFTIGSFFNIYREELYTFSNQGILIDHFSTVSLTHNNKASIGIRYFNGEILNGSANSYLQLTEQYNINEEGIGIRFGHRFRLQQRFVFKGKTYYNQRYRFSVNFPLKGQVIDVKELYIITTAEVFWIVAKQFRPKYDLRIDATLGWKISNTFDLLIGASHRIENFTIETHNKLVAVTKLNIRI